MPWPIASLASSGIRPLSSDFDFSCSRCAPRVAAEQVGELRPRIRGAHVDDAHGFDPRPGRFDAEQARRVTGLDAAPELLFGRQQQVLVQRIGGEDDFHPFAAAGDNRKHPCLGVGDPHVVLQLRHVLFGRTLLGEAPGQHELGLKDGSGSFDPAVEGRRQVADQGMPDPLLDVDDHPPGVSLVPMSIEVFGHASELDDEVARQVLGLGLAAFLPPKPEQGSFVGPHDDPGVGAADEMLSIIVFRPSQHDLAHCILPKTLMIQKGS